MEALVFVLLVIARVSHALPQHGTVALELSALDLDLSKRSSSSSSSSSPSQPGAILANRMDDSQRNIVFWAATIIAVLVSLVQGAITTLTDICESEGMWTIRFSLGRREHFWWTGIAVALIASLGSMIVSFLAGNNNDSLGILLLATASSLAVFRYAWPAWRNRHYCSNRWAAWTGPSRTGIDPVLIPYLPNPDRKTGKSRAGSNAVPGSDTSSLWRDMDHRAPTMKLHPVDIRFPLLLRTTLIVRDPTDILKAFQQTSAVPSEQSLPSTPHLFSTPAAPAPPASSKSSGSGPSFEAVTSKEKPENESARSALPPGVYAPILPGHAASLRWGRDLGFSPRVSRGILSVPNRLLTSHPLTESGHNGRALCLAHGILGRNKGLEPQNFILKLNTKMLEEKSVQWPRPSKVLRSYFKREMEAAYGGLGPAYVDAATELALLLADSSHSLIEDWLEKGMEQQDYRLNREAYVLEASDEDLRLLYLLSYAAMIVSLSAHSKQRQVRPETSLFVALWKATKPTEPLPEWVSSQEMVTRMANERAGLDSRTDLDGLIAAVLGPSPRVPVSP
ncbi:hypothetical protein EW146_g12 [Bondarzewia mesenterica]|uniref:Uncharacterized protein n=1 Tax=Bondarzewia mesenterica TaxID=1095465 RepID=A0A4S4M882_9AGAM|nr:hypothetical protein EW146_g12 [Bondarzewia mesenterica]